MKVHIIAIISFFVLFSSCNSDETTLLKSRVQEVQNNEREFAESPCELISDQDIRNICSVSTEFEITQLAKIYTYPTCTFSWKDGKNIKKVGMNKGIDFVAENEIMIVMVAKANQKSFEVSTKVYKDAEFIDGVAEKAVWGEKMSQLSVLVNGYMFHINVKILPEPEENKKIAIEIGRFLEGKV